MVIGGGAVGLVSALSIADHVSEVYVLERNSRIRDDNQSTRNSGVIHAGIYYDPEIAPLKAKLCVEGKERLYSFADEWRVPHRMVGKLVVAKTETDIEYLDDLVRISELNGVDTEMIDGHDISRYEPNVTGTCALYVPSSGIIQPERYLQKLHAACRKKGINVLTDSQVTSIEPEKDGFMVGITRPDGVERNFADYVVNSAGVYSDEIARLMDPDFDLRIAPVRGEAYKFDKTQRFALNTNGMNIYPAPHPFDPKTGEKLDMPYSSFLEHYRKGEVMKTVGVHLTSQLNGRHLDDYVTVGPALVCGIGKEDYTPSRDPQYFHGRVHWFFEDIRPDDLQFHQTGLLAKPVGKPDFTIEPSKEYPNLINLVGIDSPGLTSSLGIGNHVGELIREIR